MNEDLIRWAVGLLLVSGLLGHVVTRALVKRLNRAIEVPASETTPWEGVPSWLSAGAMGVAERFFFTLVIASGLSGSAVAMIAWIALKGAAYWNLFDSKFKASVFVALIGSLASMTFAILGGLICQGTLWDWLSSAWSAFKAAAL